MQQFQNSIIAIQAEETSTARHVAKWHVKCMIGRQTDR